MARSLLSAVTFAAIAVVVLGSMAVSAVAAPVPVTPQVLEAGRGLELRSGWRYNPGDDPSWSDPAYDDTAWAELDVPRLKLSEPLGTTWPGIGWFRIRLAVDEALVGRPVAFLVYQFGASELYLDGDLVRRFGEVSTSAAEEEVANPLGQPFALVFDRPGEHVLAVRFSSAATAAGSGMGRWWLARQGDWIGLVPFLRDHTSAVRDYTQAVRSQTLFSILFVGILGSFAALHLLLFVFHRSDRANLYYALFAFSFAGLILSEYIRSALSLPLLVASIFGGVDFFLLGSVFVWFLAFLFSAFGFDRPRYYLPLVLLWAAFAAGAVVLPDPNRFRWLASVCIFLSVTASMHMMGRALREKVYGAWIIGIGIQGFAIALIMQLVRNYMGVRNELFTIASLLMYFVLPVCVSVYLARRFAHNEQERSRKQEAELRAAAAEALALALEAENARKSRELEEARALQLSMLPRQLPELPHIEVGVFMQTATEVGGDYYDFHLSDDGVLTVAIGDATGHGLRAGTLVATTKGLFRVLGENPDIRGTFGKLTRTFKEMKLGQLYMAMTIAKLHERRLTISAAGMPPALVFRAATGEVEKVVLRGMPLGAFANFRYELQELELREGDTVLLMSDGFPELFNDKGEMLDYDRAAELFREAADGPPDEVIASLRRHAEQWSNGRPPDDDMTFVVLKLRGAGE